MKINVEVFQDPADGSFLVRTRMFEAEVEVGEIFLPGGNTLNEAEDLSRSLIRLADTGFDMLKLMPKG